MMTPWHNRAGGPGAALMHAVFSVMLLMPVFANAQEVLPSESLEPSETLEIPSLEEELGSTPPWQQAIPVPGASASPPVSSVETEPQRRAKTVMLNGLDKITGRISEFAAPVDQPAQFGTLQITARTCHKRPAEETPETSAYLEITDLGFAVPSATAQSKGQQIFSGWMFASSPSLSALEHPVYDVWVIDCKTSLPQDGSGVE